MGDTAARIAEIERRLAWLRQEDGAGTVFGADTHRYRADAALSEEQLAAFEREHDVTLPASYRAYLGAVANGGGGPYYGLSPLAPLEIDELPRNHVEVKNAEGDVLAAAGTGPREVPDATSTLARPFRLTGEWSPQDGPLPVEPGTSPYDGCVHLADQGCGYFDFLVVRGDAAGQVWSDYTAGDGPISKSHDDFLDWYEDWLDLAQREWLTKNAIGMALWAPRNYPGIDDCVRLVDEALERSPAWATGWRTRGYVHLNREQYDDAMSAFEKAAEHGKDEPAARLHLDRARVAMFRGQWETALQETEAGLGQKSLWASTRSELQQARLGVYDEIGDADGALATLAAMLEDTYFHLDNHFELAYRRLVRDEPDEAWAVLDHAVTENIGPNRHRDKATREGVYGQFADWLDERDAGALARAVRNQL